MKTQNILPETIEMRAMNHINKGVEIIEAVKLAIEEELNFLASLYDGGFVSERGNKVTEIMSNRIWKKANGL